jgi:phenylacetate-coenzyme A ligase PaaK-like adenylate-forming protein
VQAIRLLFNWEPTIWRYQVIQDSLDRFRVLLVTAPGSDRAEIQKLTRQKFSDALGSGVSAQIEFVEELPRGARGKTPAVVPLAD